MSLLRNSVIVGGATFLVGSAFMEIGKADSKSDIGRWPYVATFLSGALGFYLLKQNFIPVPKALELNADSDNIIRFKVGEQYEHRYHHGYGFRDNEIMRRTDKTVWTSQVNPETGKVDYPLLVSRHKIYTKQPFEIDGEIVLGYESYGLGNHAYGVTAGDTSLRTYGADYTDSDLSHFGKPLEDDEEFTTMQVRIGSPSGITTLWTSAFNVECIGDEDNLSYLTYDLEYEIKERVKFPFWNPNTIEDPRNPPSKTTMQIVMGSPSGSTTSWYRAFEVLAHDEMYGEDLSYLSGEIHDLVVERVKRWNGDEVIYDAETFEANSLKGKWNEGTTRNIHGVEVTKHRYGEDEKPQYRASYNGFSCRIFYEGVAFYLPCWMYRGYGGVGRQGCFKNPIEAILDFKMRADEGFKTRPHRIPFDAESYELSEIIFEDVNGKSYTTKADYDHSLINEVVEDDDLEELRSFAAEVFEADRKIRRRTRWTWTRGQESGFEVENDDISELPYDIDYTGEKGRGYRSTYVPLYSIEDSYHISDLPEGYHLHLYKPSVRSGSWRAFSKSPTSDWEEYTDYKKSNLTGELLSWYNQDIAKPEEKTLSPIEKLMISKGMKSGTIQIERVVIPSTPYTPEKVQYFAFGGPRNMKPTKVCEIEGGVIVLESLTSNESNLFAFAQGMKFMTEKAGTLRSVNRFNKDPEAWVKSYPAWFQNAVKTKLTDIDLKYTGFEEYQGGIKINGIVVLKFLNGVGKFEWTPINKSERKMIDTPYGEMPQFEIYELDMNDPAPIIPRPSTMRKIYAKSFKQNLSGDWKFDEEMFMMAVVDKYKFENGGSEKIHNSMVDEPIYSIDIIPYMTPMAELMARRFKKKE